MSRPAKMQAAAENNLDNEAGQTELEIVDTAEGPRDPIEAMTELFSDPLEESGCFAIVRRINTVGGKQESEYLQRYDGLCTPDVIRKDHGGGLYHVTIYSNDPNRAAPTSRVKANFRIRIAGSPKEANIDPPPLAPAAQHRQPESDLAAQLLKDGYTALSKAQTDAMNNNLAMITAAYDRQIEGERQRRESFNKTLLALAPIGIDLIDRFLRSRAPATPTAPEAAAEKEETKTTLDQFIDAIGKAAPDLIERFLAPAPAGALGSGQPTNPTANNASKEPSPDREVF